MDITQITETGSDQDVLITHPQGLLKIETAIQAGKRTEKPENRRERISFNGGGIIKTVDVSHSVSDKI